MAHGVWAIKWTCFTLTFMNVYSVIYLEVQRGSLDKLVQYSTVKYNIVQYSVRIAINAGDAVPSDEQVTSKDQNRQSGIFDNSSLTSAGSGSPVTSALSNDERKKFDEERIKLFVQLDEKVSVDLSSFMPEDKFAKFTSPFIIFLKIKCVKHSRSVHQILSACFSRMMKFKLKLQK